METSKILQILPIHTQYVMNKRTKWTVKTNCALSVYTNWMTDDRRTYLRSRRTGPNRKGAVPRAIKNDVTVQAF